jgi:hypothetical protein
LVFDTTVFADGAPSARSRFTVHISQTFSSIHFASFLADDGLSLAIEQ